MNNAGKVYFLGVGPGDPKLITVKALEVLRHANCIVYDNQINQRLLGEANPLAELILIAEDSSSPYQSYEISKIISEKAREGLIVARLCCGDPFVFGAASREALELAADGIIFETVPGVSPAIAVPAYSGIPVTHPEIGTQCLFMNVMEYSRDPERQIDWKTPARLRNTNIVIYTAANLVQTITDDLIMAGMAPDMPAAIIENGTMPRQRTFTGTLTTIASLAIENKVESPFILFLGPTATMNNELCWFERKTMFGKRIIATRAVDRLGGLMPRLEELGADVMPLSVSKPEKVLPDFPVSRQIKETSYDWIIFRNELSVRFFMAQLQGEGSNSRLLHSARIAAIGRATAARLRNYGIIADFVPSKFSSKDFAAEFTKVDDRSGEHILVVSGDHKENALAETFSSLGSSVDILKVYKITQESSPDILIDGLMTKGADACLFTSRGMVDSFFEILGEDFAHYLLKNTKVVAIGPMTAVALYEWEIHNITTAKNHSVDGMIDTLLQLFEN